MSDEGRQLGAALMEANTVRPTVSLRGVAFGDTMAEVAEKANSAAWEFFATSGYELEIDVEFYGIKVGGKREEPRYIGRWYARLA